MPENRPNFGDRLKQIRADLVIPAADTSELAQASDSSPESMPVSESPSALREKFLRYRSLKSEATDIVSNMQSITAQLEQAEALLSGEVSKPEASQSLQSLLGEMREAMGNLQGDLGSREQLLQELMTPAFEHFIEQAAQAEVKSKMNVEQLKELLDSKKETLHPVHRAQLLGKLYGLEPSEQNKAMLSQAIIALAAQGRYYGDTSSWDATKEAILEAIEFSESAPDVKDLIELVYPSKEVLAGKSADDRKTLESLYGYARIEAYGALTRKRIQTAIDQSKPEDLEIILASLKGEREQYGYSLGGNEVVSLQRSLVEIYLNLGNTEKARALVSSPEFTADRVSSYLGIFKRTGDAADLKSAREVKIYNDLYSETQKWQEIGEASGEEKDFSEANAALERMNKDSFYYSVEALFKFYERMSGLRGIDKVMLEKILKEKIKEMSQLDRAKAYIVIATISGSPEDEKTLREELAKTLGLSEAEFKKKSILYTGQDVVLDSPSGYGYLLYDFLNYIRSDLNRRTPANRETANRLLAKFEETSQYQRTSGRAIYLFHDGLNGAKERTKVLFQTEPEFKGELDRSDKEQLWKQGWMRIQYYNLESAQAGNNRQALQNIFETLKSKCSAKEFGDNVSGLLWRFMGVAKTEQDYRFVETMVGLYQTPEIPVANEVTLDLLHSKLAEFSVHNNEADQHISLIRDDFRRGLSIASVAKARREISQLAA